MMNDNLALKKTTIESLAEVQAILDSAEYYYMQVEGVPRMENSAKEVFESLPPNSTYDDKHVFFIDLDNQHIGVVEMIFGYPTKEVAFIGLLLLDQKFHGRGLGRRSYELVESFAREHGASSIQLGVNDTNEVGMNFWTKVGFKPNGRSRPNQGLKVLSTAIVLEKPCP